MSDTQPLLPTTSTFSLDDHDKERKSLMNTFSKWRRYLGLTRSHDEYEKLDNDGEQNKKQIFIGIFEMFRFADRIDLLLLIIGLCTSLIFASCMIINYSLIARLTGLFAVKQSSISPCPDSNENSSVSNGCPWSNQLYLFNSDRLNSLCNNVTKTDTFRDDVMNKVYWLIIVGSIELISEYIQYLVINVAAKRQTSRIRVRLFRSLLQRNIPYFDMNSSGQITGKLFENISNIDRGIGYEFSMLIALMFFIITSIIISLTTNWELTLIVLCAIPILIAGSYVFSKFIAKETTNEMNAYSKAGHIVEEVFSSLRIVLSFNGQQFEQKRYERELNATQRSSVRKGLFLGLFIGWTFFIVYITYSVGFICTFFLLNKDKLSDALVVLVLLTQGIIFIGWLGPSIQSILEARAAATQVFSLIDQEKSTDDNEGGIWKNIGVENQSIDINGDIEFHNVSFVYPSRNDQSILSGLNLVARAGETTALVGPSGCGKSTCLALLLRYYSPSSGQITINGRSIAEYNVRELRHSIGVVSQEPILFDTTIYENIRYGQENATKDQIEEAARQANAHDFIMKLPEKYLTLVGERGIQLSGGEKQRIALARALIKQPILLLLDEATSALDSNSEKIVQEALDRSSKNRTTIVITHRLSTIQNADRIYVLNNGRVIEEGTHDTLMAKEDGTHDTLMAKEDGTYKQMVNLQQLEKLDEQTTAKTDDEEEQYERIDRMNDNRNIIVDKKKLPPKNEQMLFFRILSLNRPEWLIILIGCLMSIGAGTIQVIVAILLPKMIDAFNKCIYDQQRHQVLIISGLFLFLALLVLFVRLAQFMTFALSGSRLTQRIRFKAFSCLLRQEVAYFDQPENSSGSICTRLQSDASSIQKMAGTRLGVVCEILAMSGLAFILGLCVSYQLTLVIFLPLIVIIVITYLDIRFKAKINERSDQKIEQASSLAVEAIHNLRIVKQLAAEEEILRKYSELVDQSFIIHRNSSIVSGVAYAIFWSSYSFIFALLYWCAMNLLENGKLEPENMLIVFAFQTFFLYFVQAIATMTEDIGASLKASRSFFQLFDRIPSIDNVSNEGQQLMNFRGGIEFNDVKFSYPSRSKTYTVLNNFQLSIKPGQHVALVGNYIYFTKESS